jgi:hypothetical protein
MDQTLLIDDEPNKALQNPKWSRLFLEPFKGCELPKNKMQWLKLASWLWLVLKGLPFAMTVYAHFVVIMQFLRSLLNSRYPSYSWFKEFEGSSSGHSTITQLPLGDVLSTHFPSLFQLCFPCFSFDIGLVICFYFMFC